MKFSGKKVLITGAASGIGLAQTKVFLAEGAEVVAVDLQEFTDESVINSKNLSVKILDVSDAQSVEKLADEVGSIDVLLNTAGVLDAYKTLEETDFAEWQSILSTNLNSMYLMISAFLPKMKVQKSGVIINMASVAGLVAGGGGVAYTASKHAIVGLTKQLALDEAQHGIQVAAIAPGAINTPMNAADFTENNGQMAQWVADETPAKRWASPREVADLTLFLASPQASYMSGAIVPIDGGWTIK
ncbi:3-oxoacyl-ACP reductase [Lactococcus lactis]|jgi:3-oxoacyl-[acyl-carrier protein] reductase|uniref:3-oxoacyl-ACP reductase n=1 Tax=Lactococcus lactis TaxID=1358 RepID=A0AAP5PB75_9LACT|nr:3-oxoacyl-ACP reductase [Lactococcus lactis]MDT2859615.1 3-oxoacyl-ACP reductase [Lactococcus lactis]MDT2862757.1 3-oxoacyl-ACP reductase [Lactococcus lactis]MDT2867816.1 3-oxoacyl-ACP reductase [Lactococcus lactis]MDT2870902.1 3-oxoacyl-ACP reductase [Lactococcus lactis]MDT2873337.1 3-oxoacyl-ACP reductase [Lactococcus lactis]